MSEPTAILHLAGEQALPIYFGMRQFESPSLHVVAVTDRTRPVGETVRKVCAGEGVKILLLELTAYDLRQNVRRLTKFLEAHPAPAWYFNLTGGTKPMFAAAYQVAQSRNAPCFYVETVNRTLDWLIPPDPAQESPQPLKPSLGALDTVIRLAGYEPAAPVPDPDLGTDAEGRDVLRLLWEHRRVLAPAHRDPDLEQSCRYPGVPFRLDRTLGGIRLQAELKGPEQHYEGRLTIQGKTLTRQPWHTLAAFIVSGWLEQYLAARLMPLRRDGRLRDMAGNLTVQTRVGDRQNPFQEFDLAFTDGFCLTIVECKAGRVEQAHVQKLENLRQRFGGHFGKGVLVAVWPNELDRVRERVERSAGVGAVAAAVVVKNPAILLDIKPGEVRLH